MKEIGTTGSNRTGVREHGEVAEGAGRSEPDDRDPDDREPDGAWMSRALHDLSQPLTALECLLYVNREPVAGDSLDAGFLRSVMDEGLAECGRMMVLVRQMQDRLVVEKEGP